MLAEPGLKLHRLPLLWAGLGLGALLPCNKLTCGLDALTLVSGDRSSARGLPAAPKKPQGPRPHHGAGCPSRAQLREQSEDSKGSQAQTWQSPSQWSDCWSLCHVSHGEGWGWGARWSTLHQVCRRISKAEGTEWKPDSFPGAPGLGAPRPLPHVPPRGEQECAELSQCLLPPTPPPGSHTGRLLSIRALAGWGLLRPRPSQGHLGPLPFIPGPPREERLERAAAGRALPPAPPELPRSVPRGAQAPGDWAAAGAERTARERERGSGGRPGEVRETLPRAPSRFHPRDLPGEESRRCASRPLTTFFPSHPHNVCKWPLSLFCKWGVCAHKTYCRRRPALRGRRSDSAATRSEPAEAGPCAPSRGLPLRGRCWAPGAARTDPQTRWAEAAAGWSSGLAQSKSPFKGEGGELKRQVPSEEEEEVGEEKISLTLLPLHGCLCDWKYANKPHHLLAIKS